MPKSPMTEVLQRAAAHRHGLAELGKPLIDRSIPYIGSLLRYCYISYHACLLRVRRTDIRYLPDVHPKPKSDTRFGILSQIIC